MKNSDNNLMQIIEQPFARSRLFISYMTSAGMFMVIAIASLTSSQVFSEIYNLVAEFLSLGKVTVSLRNSPGFGHFICYALLGLSLTGVFSRHFIFLAPLVAVLFGVVMELVQVFIPSRDASLMDIGLNVLGVGLGFGVYLVWVRIQGG